MTTIQALIQDSLKQPLAGFIRVTLDYKVTNGTTQALQVPVPSDINLVNGEATFDLEGTVDDKVTYLFQVYKTGTPPVLVDEFRAMVPDQIATLEFSDLARETGITHDALDSSLVAATRRIYQNGDFWATARTELFPDRGAWSSTIYYQNGDMVTYNGSWWLCLSPVPVLASNPITDEGTLWRRVASKGDTGTGTAGNDSAYDPVSWDGATDAPSRNAVRDIIETLATKTQVNAKVSANGAVLTNASVGDTLPINENSSRIAYASWVQAIANEIKKSIIPVGTIAAYAGTSAPQYWLIADGREISRSTYSALYDAIGTNFGVGNGTSTFNLPDYRGRSIVGADNMSALMGAANVTPAAVFGQKFGAATHTLSANEMPQHNHGPSSGIAFVHQVASGGSALAGGTPTAINVGTSSVTANAGSGAAHNNVQPSTGSLVIIFAGV